MKCLGRDDRDTGCEKWNVVLQRDVSTKIVNVKMHYVNVNYYFNN